MARVKRASIHRHTIERVEDWLARRSDHDVNKNNLACMEGFGVSRYLVFVFLRVLRLPHVSPFQMLLPNDPRQKWHKRERRSNTQRFIELMIHFYWLFAHLLLLFFLPAIIIGHRTQQTWTKSHTHEHLKWTMNRMHLRQPKPMNNVLLQYFVYANYAVDSSHLQISLWIAAWGMIMFRT